MEIIRNELPSPPPNSYVAIDLEIFGLNPKQIHRPTSGRFSALTICYEPDKVYLCDNVIQIPNYLASIQNCIWIGHNLKFDLTHLRRWTDIPKRNHLVDTMLIERILWNGYYDRFGLDSLSRRYLDTFLDKSLQDKFEDAVELTDEFIDYAVKDASTTLLIWREQKKHLTQTDMEIYKEIDLPAMWAIMDFMGFRLNVEKWQMLAEINRVRQREIDAQLPFNPRSPKQVLEHLRSKGYNGLKDTQAETLEKKISRYPDKEATHLASKVLESRKYGTWASRYGMNFIENYLEEEDGYYIICSNYNVTGAESGRMSSSDPNAQNIPVRETSEFRECFIPRPGNVLLVGDYSAQEVRIMGYLTGDKKLKEIFGRGGDIYIEVGKEVFGKTFTKDDPLRARMKSTILGIDYGMSARGLAEREGISDEEAEDILTAFFRAFPNVGYWINQQKKNKNMVRTVSGRRCHLNAYSDQCERNALNSPIQGTAADMMKKALGTMHKEWDFDDPFACVGVIHDEVIFDVPKEIAPKVRQFICDVMVQTGNEMCKGMPFEADVKECSSWADKK